MRLAGKSMDAICSSLRMSKTTVKKYNDLAERSNKSLEELRHMEDKDLAQLLTPESPPPITDSRKTEQKIKKSLPLTRSNTDLSSGIICSAMGGIIYTAMTGII